MSNFYRIFRAYPVHGKLSVNVTDVLQSPMQDAYPHEWLQSNVAALGNIRQRLDNGQRDKKVVTRSAEAIL